MNDVGGDEDRRRFVLHKVGFEDDGYLMMTTPTPTPTPTPVVVEVKNLPAGSTVTLTCTGKGCARGLKKPGFTKSGASGTLWLTTTKVLTIRSGKAPTLH
ncbi:MAG TPA: hypothetical protein VI300_29195 [Solirubrobacter sp.]